MRRLVLAATMATLVAVGTLPAFAHEEADEGHASAFSTPAVGATFARTAFTGVINLSGQQDATALSSTPNVEYVGGDNNATGGHIAFEGDRMYVGSYGFGMRIFSLADPADPQLIGQYMPGLRMDAVPDAAVFGGRHIAILNGTRRNSRGPTEARTDKSEFLDVTDPANPKLLWTFVGPDDGEAHNGDIYDRRRLWFPSGGLGDNGLRIYDLQPLLGAEPQAPARLFPPQSCRDSADITCDPVKLWENSPYRSADEPVGAPFTHTHDIEIYPKYPVKLGGKTLRRDIIMLAEGGNYVDDNGNTGSVFVIDVTNPKNPVVLLRWLHERGEGHHPIRYHHEVQFIDGLRNVMLVTDEDMHNGCGSAGGAVAVRLTPDLQSATELSEWFIPFGTPAPVCSVHVFSSDEGTVYFGSYNAGLQIVDYSDPANPQRVGEYIAEGTTAWGAYVRGEYIYVGDMSRGLDVFRYTGQ